MVSSDSAGTSNPSGEWFNLVVSKIWNSLPTHFQMCLSLTVFLPANTLSVVCLHYLGPVYVCQYQLYRLFVNIASFPFV